MNDAEHLANAVAGVEGHFASYMRLCEVLGLDPEVFDSTKAQSKAADEIDRLRAEVERLDSVCPRCGINRNRPVKADEF
jgi:hypothetical protein